MIDDLREIDIYQFEPIIPLNVKQLPNNIVPSTITDNWFIGHPKRLNKGDICGYYKGKDNKLVFIESLALINRLISGFYYKSSSKRIIIPYTDDYINTSDIIWFRI